MSKITLHFQRIPDWFGEFVDRCQGQLEYIVGVDVFPNVPGVKTLGRTYLPDGESGALVDRGAAGADEWIDRFAATYAVNPHVDKWIGPNEYVIWDQDAADRFNAFHVRFIERMSGFGHGVVCGQINVGWPRLRMFNDPPPYPEALAPTLAALWAHGGLFSLHEYGPGDMRDGAGAHCLRYRNTRAELLAAGVVSLPDFIITETGIDVPNPQAPQDHQGWRDFATWEQYFDQLKWYSGELDKDPYMLGASIFTVADDWFTFQLHREEAMPLADWIASDQDDDDDDEEETVEGVKVFDINGQEKDWAWLTEKYGAVEIQQPNVSSYYKVVELRERHADSAFIAKVLEADGSPRVGKTVLFYWPDAPDAPGSGWLEQGVGGRTNESGDVGFGMGQGAYYFAPYQGPHKSWLFGDDVSEMLEGIGMLGGTDHWHVSATWQYVEDDDDPEPLPIDGDLEAVVEQLARIADSLEALTDYVTR